MKRSMIPFGQKMILRNTWLALALRVSSVEKETAFRYSTIGQSRCFFSPGSSASIKPISGAFTCCRPLLINHGFQRSFSSNDGELVHAVVPHLGASISEGTLAKFLNSPGDRVEVDEAIAQVIIDIVSPQAGVIQKFISQKGETVEPGMKIAVICKGAQGAVPAAIAEKAAADPSPAWKRTENTCNLIQMRRMYKRFNWAEYLSSLITLLPFLRPNYGDLNGDVRFKLTGKVQNGVTATDLVMTFTAILPPHRDYKFVEFYGEGVGPLSLADRATIARATMGFFPIDHVTLDYLKIIGRTDEEVSMLESYLRGNKLFVDYNEPQQEKIFSRYIEFDLGAVELCITGLRRPRDRVPLKHVKNYWHSCIIGSMEFSLPKEMQDKVVKFGYQGQPAELKHGSVVIAAITSCRKTSNTNIMLGAGFAANKASELSLEASAMLGAGLVAKKACELDLEVKPWVKTSLAPGSGLVTKYLLQSGLQKYLNQQGFNIVGYGCATCIGNYEDLDESVSAAISENYLVAAAVFSGDWKFQGHYSARTRAKFLASPPLIVAYALAGTVDIDFDKDPIGTGKDGKSVYFRDIWPTNEEITQAAQSSALPDMFKQAYEAIRRWNPVWEPRRNPSGQNIWDPSSTFIHDPPYFKNISMDPPGPHGVKGAYCLFNISVPIRMDTSEYFYHRTRGVSASVLHENVGPLIVHIPTGEKISVFDAAMTERLFALHRDIKRQDKTQSFLTDEEYGSGRSIYFAAKGYMLPGVKAVIAKSFESINRSNLVEMAILPLCFKAGEDAKTLGLTGYERFTIDLPSKVREIRPGQDITVTTDSGKSFTCTLRFDTEVELDYFDHGGILPYMIRKLKA